MAATPNPIRLTKRLREGITFSFFMRKGIQSKRINVSPKKNTLISVANNNHERNNPKENCRLLSHTPEKDSFQ